MNFLFLILQGAVFGLIAGLAFGIGTPEFNLGMFLVACVANSILTVAYGTLKEFEQ